MAWFDFIFNGISSFKGYLIELLEEEKQEIIKTVVLVVVWE